MKLQPLFRIGSNTIILIQVDDHVASVIIAQLLFLQSESPFKPINLYINSPGSYDTQIYFVFIYQLFYFTFLGGSVTAGLGIYDTIQYIRPPVATWCVGQACSMGSFLLASGAHGMRHSLPNARIMVHQPLGGAQVLV